MRLSWIALVLAVGLLAAGCGSTNEATPTTTTTSTTPAQTAVKAYFLLDGKLQPVRREVDDTDAAVTQTLAALVDGPTKAERELRLRSAIPDRALELDVSRPTSGAPGVAVLDVKKTTLEHAALGQVVFTLTQFPTVTSVQVEGRRLTRGDFEDVTPAILVESPLPFEEVPSPVHATGTANTFEATFQYELTDTDGKIVDKNFVTATSGNGTRGTFDFTTKPYTVPFTGVGGLIVYEISAENGRRIHLVEIPLKMRKAG